MLVLLLACSGPPSKGGGGQTSADSPPAYSVSDYTDREPPAFEPDLSQVEPALQAVIDTLLDAPADPVLDAYASVIAWAEEGCPDLYEVDGNSFWYDYCYASNGASFSGYGSYTLYDQTDGGDGFTYDGAAIYGQGQITDPDGHTLALGGAAGVVHGRTEDGILMWLTAIDGSFAWDGPEAEGTWLEEERQPTNTIQAYRFEGYELRALVVDIATHPELVDSRGEPLDLATAVVDDTVIGDVALGFPCDEEPSGSISLRDGQGLWYEVRFDVVVDGESYVLDGECDGCGTVSVNGEALGEACADFSAWLGWGDEPW